MIGFDAQSLTGTGQTGLGVYSRGLARALEKFSDQVRLELLWPKYRKPFRRTIERLAWERFGLPGLAGKSGVQLLHVPCFAAPPMRNIPVVVTAHDLIVLKHPGLMPAGSRWYFSRWIPGSYHRADHIIAVSESTRDDLVELLGINSEKITVIHHGIDPAFQKSIEPKEQARVREAYFVPRDFFLMVGSFEPRKNVDVALRAFSRIADEYETLKFVLVGRNSPYREKLIERVSESGISDRISFLGYIPDRDLSTLYSICTSFIFPSSAEGFGLPLIEAMSSGAPVIASDLKVFHEVAGDAACYHSTGNDIDLAEKMHRMVNDTSFALQCREKGFRRAGDFSWSTAAQHTIEVYARILMG